LAKGKDKKITEVSASTLKGKTVGIYFSAHWCPPCRIFTPELIKTYNTLLTSKKPFEIIYVSSDKGDKEFEEYYESMPWMSIPYSDEDRRTALNSRFGVEGIPTLAIVDYDSGLTITKDGREAVSSDPTGQEFPWTPKPVNELSRMNAGGLNDTAALIVFLSDSDEEKKVMGGLESLATEVLKASPDDLLFFIAKKDPVVPRVKALLGSKGANAFVAILDIPKSAVFFPDNISKVTEFSDETIRAFYKKYKDGTLKGTPLSKDDD